jgi:hypothetical protein
MASIGVGGQASFWVFLEMRFLFRFEEIARLDSKMIVSGAGI